MNQSRFFPLFILFLGALWVAGCAAAPGPNPTATAAPPTTAVTLTTAPTALPTEPLPVTGDSAASTATAAPTQAETPSPQPAAAESARLPLECSAPAELTPPQTEGPYFTPDSPEKAVLLEENMPGTRLILEGYMLTPDCTPIASAKVDFWQADANGQYDNQGYRLRGHQFTDVDGYYRLETVIPGEYPGRPPHIHVKVTPPGGVELTSQVYFPGFAGNQADRIFNPATLVRVISEGPEGMHAAFNFVVSAP